jgi:hypothetical protein
LREDRKADKETGRHAANSRLQAALGLRNSNPWAIHEASMGEADQIMEVPGTESRGPDYPDPASRRSLKELLINWGKRMGQRKLELSSVQFKIPKGSQIDNCWGPRLETAAETTVDWLEIKKVVGPAGVIMSLTADQGSLTMYEVNM